MSYDTARQQHIKWIQQQIEEKIFALTEAENRVSHLKADIEYFKLMLSIHENANTDALSQDTLILPYSDQSYNKEPNSIQTSNSGFVGNSENGVEDDRKRSPKEMLRAEFADTTLAELAEFVLSSRNEPMTADDIAQYIFLTQDNDEYVRARNSLSTELRRGAKEGRWKQIGRGSFVSIKSESLRDKNIVPAYFSTNGNRTSN